MQKSNPTGSGFLPYLWLQVFLTVYLILFETIVYGMTGPVMEPMLPTVGEYFTFLFMGFIIIFSGIFLFSLLALWFKEKFFSGLNKWIYHSLVSIICSVFYLLVTQIILHDDQKWIFYALVPLTTYAIFFFVFECFLYRRYFSK